jgi:hypothetical protein
MHQLLLNEFAVAETGLSDGFAYRIQILRRLRVSYI